MDGRRVWVAVGCLVGLMSGGMARAELRLPHLLSDHAVLQRERPIHVWGWAAPGTAISVGFHTQDMATKANDLGEWELWLQPEAAGGPYALTVDGGSEGTKMVKDVLVGDVWVASGQSNMEFPLSGFAGAPMKDQEKEIAAATQPKLRLLVVPKKASDLPVHDQPGTWQECTPATAAKFSAVAYFFGRELAMKEGVPIGLVDSTWGGTPADAWVSMTTLGTDARLTPAFASRAVVAEGQSRWEEHAAAFAREDAAAKAAGQPAPKHPWHPDEGSWRPAGLYNGMIAPLIDYGVKGFIWYQGETNASADRAPYYASLFPALIGDWRARFGQGDLPFLWAQISSYTSSGDGWGIVRDAQRRTLGLRATAMAVTTDVGQDDNVHPPDKQTVGARLALGARGMVYGEKVEYSSPLFRQVTTTPGGMRVWFDHAKGLTAKGNVTGFEVAGEDRKYGPATATIDGETVVVKSSVAAPMYVRYGWTSVISESIYNEAGLPMSTFSSDAVAGR